MVIDVSSHHREELWSEKDCEESLVDIMIFITNHKISYSWNIRLNLLPRIVLEDPK